MRDELHERFQRLQRDGCGDWGEVLRRAGKRRVRRRVVVAAGLVAVVALVAPAALALRGSIVDFFESERAPRALVHDFERMDVGAPPGLENRVVYAEARRIFERKLHTGQVLTLWVAPNRRGGYCTAFTGRGRSAGFGCLWANRRPLSRGIEIGGPITSDGVIEGGPFLIHGSVEIEGAEAIELQYEGGRAETQALTWVSEPIDAAFFLFDVRPAHWGKGARPEQLVVRDGDGDELFSEPVRLPRFVLP